jgi:hypothetical protein
VCRFVYYSFLSWEQGYRPGECKDIKFHMNLLPLSSEWTKMDVGFSRT